MAAAIPRSGDPLSAGNRYEEYVKGEISGMDAELKSWWIGRRLAMERNLAIKNQLQTNNFTGFSMNTPDLPDTEKVLWGDLVTGKPNFSGLDSADGREMKSDMYMNMFKGATDFDNLCRTPGVAYLRCMKSSAPKGNIDGCNSAFNIFDACRKGLQQQQSAALDQSLTQQDVGDRRARALFERRTLLLNSIIKA